MRNITPNSRKAYWILLEYQISHSDEAGNRGTVDFIKRGLPCLSPVLISTPPSQTKVCVSTNISASAKKTLLRTMRRDFERT